MSRSTLQGAGAVQRHRQQCQIETEGGLLKEADLFGDRNLFYLHTPSINQ